MTRIRKNAGVIGRNVVPRANSRSGVWSMDDVVSGKRLSNTFDPSQTRRGENWQNGDFDPYYTQTVIHLDDAPANTLMKDKSGNEWETFLGPLQYYTHHIPTFFGPRYTDWSTKFHEDAYYTVADYVNLRFGSSPFTIEFWFKDLRNDLTEHYIMGKGTGAGRASATLGWVIYITSGNKIGFYDGAANTSAESLGTVIRDQWHHVAIVRDATNTVSVWLDGTDRGTASIGTNYTDTNPLYVGRDRGLTGTTWFGGMITDIRVTNNIQYSGTNFPRPTGSLNHNITGVIFSLPVTLPYHNNILDKNVQALTITITGQPARIIDSPFPSNLTRLTGHGSHSAYVLDTNRAYKLYDTAPANTSQRFGVSPFTVEAWVYYTFGGFANTSIIGKGTGNAGAGTGWNLRINGSGFLCWDDGNSTFTSTTGAITYGGWYHLAAVREGTSTNQFKMYVNGALTYTGTLASNYSGSDTMYIFASRNNQYGFRGFICGLRMSTVARYTGTFEPFNTAFIDSAMSVTTGTTSLLMCTTGNDFPVPDAPAHINYGLQRNALWRRGNEFRWGPQHPFSRRGGSISNNIDGNAVNIIATTTVNDFNFGTGNFSIEFWFMTQDAYQGFNFTRVLFDSRTVMNDTGIAMMLRPRFGIDVITSGRTVLDTNESRIIGIGSWHHICVQRVSGAMALYVDGKKRAESLYTAAINSPPSKMSIGNGSHPSIQYTSHAYGYIADFRILNGSAAYAYGAGNPEVFSVPVRPLTTITNTVLLTATGPTARDYSSRNNYADIGGRNSAFFTSAWSAYQNSNGPYSYLSWEDTFNDPGAPGRYLTGDASDTNCGFEGWGVWWNDSTYHDFSWTMHLVKPWTIEAWVFVAQVNPANPASGSGYTAFYTSTSAGHEGWQLQSNLNNGGNASWGDWCFTFRTAHNSVQNRFGTASGGGNIRPHSWNHVVIQFDPGATNKFAMFSNGVRVSTSAAFTAGQKTWCTYKFMCAEAGIGGVRISTIARYNNDITSLTVPYNGYTNDQYTYMLTGANGGYINKTQICNHYWYGAAVSYKYKKFGNGSLKFSNKETTLTERINFSGGWWNPQSIMTRQMDFTVECWACWFDAAAGGEAPQGTVGNVLWHYANNVMVRINSTGFWKFDHASGGGTAPTVNQTYTSDVLAATATSGRFDHIVVMRKNGNFYYYINGIEKSTALGAQVGSYTAGQGITYDNNPDYSSDTGWRLGCDWNDDNATCWTGFMQDFRFTHVARYETRVIGGVPTMVHNGTRIPALPTRISPSK